MTALSTSSAAPALDLTIPSPGSSTAARLFAHSLGRLTREIVELARTPSEPSADQARFAREVLRLTRDEPAAWPALLRSPELSTFLRCRRTARDATMRGRLEVAIRAQLFFELAMRGALPEPARLERAPTMLSSSSTRAVLEVPAGTAVMFASGMSRSDALDAFTEIAPSIVLSLRDTNPLALEEAHPDKSGNAVDLGGHPAAEWRASLTEALAIIGTHLPDLRRELDLFAQQIVPVGYDADRHLSASYGEAIGTLYLSLHPSVLTMAEALIHEASHGKLNALFETDPVIENAFAPLYTSPVRPDPRPLHGVLLAVHAFLPVARMYERMIAADGGQRDAKLDAQLRARFDQVCRINAEGAEVLLRNARPTVRGRALLAEIRRWIDHYAARA